MALLPTKQRDQVMVVVCLVALGALGLFYMYVWSPKQEQLATIETHVNALDSLNTAVKHDIARGNVAQVKRQADEYARQLDVLHRLVPTANEVPALLEQVSTASRMVGLELAEVIPEGVVQGDQFDTYKYKLGVSGPYHRLAQFLTNVGSLPRIVAPINLTLVPSQRSDIHTHKGDALIDARFEILTYVAHNAPAKTAGGSPAGAP